MVLYSLGIFETYYYKILEGFSALKENCFEMVYGALIITTNPMVQITSIVK